MKTPLREEGSPIAEVIRIGVTVLIALVFVVLPRMAKSTPFDESATVYLLLPEAPRAPLDEAVYRISAELRAVGFEIERRNLNPPKAPSSVDLGEDLEGALEESSPDGATQVGFDVIRVAPRIELDSKSELLEIRAYSEPDATPLVQAMRWDEVESAEVIAIRAVELLRAAMLQSLRDERTRASPSSVVVRFTGHRQQESPLKPQVIEAASHSTQEPSKRTGRSERPLRWIVATGAGIYGEGSNTTPQLSGEILGSLMFGAFFVGASLDGSVLPLSWSLSEGNLDVRQLSLHWRGGVRMPCPSRWECHLGAAAGYHGLFIQSKSSAGQSATTVRHAGLLLSGDALIARFWSSGLGLFSHGRVGALLDAPSAQDDPSAGPLGRPSYNVTAGIAFRSDL